ncbi:hypothetical protein CBM2589_A90143 [Cupriavidus taiwanensis]|uniref:Uncharacterized protein n=1 Tax=Cupriavidus taiwanensis TaxID=164546 RepID=A0A976A944_9BURK|nr:hypothetical protein CBM2589_A90143 [Cupriavidus taiwanensis]
MQPHPYAAERFDPARRRARAAGPVSAGARAVLCLQGQRPAEGGVAGHGRRQPHRDTPEHSHGQFPQSPRADAAARFHHRPGRAARTASRRTPHPARRRSPAGNAGGAR